MLSLFANITEYYPMHLWFMKVRDVVFVHNYLRLADKLCQVDYSEKSLEWAETDTDSDSDCEL